MTPELPLAVPQMMRAAFIRQTGSADQIEVGQLPVPVPMPDQALVHMRAAAVNHVDMFVRSGAYRTPLPFPFVIGRDLVGVVVRTGAEVRGFKRGDLVWCNSLGYAGRQGAFSQYAAISADRLYRLPEGLDAVSTVALFHPAATAYLGLVREAALQSTETVLVGGAGGAVGSAVVQLAVALGAKVIATASAQDAEWCRNLGATEVLDYRSPNLDQEIRAAAPDGVDVWWDTSGHHDFGVTIEHLRIGGRIIVMAGLAAQTQLPVGALYTRDVSLLGFAISNAKTADLATAAKTINRLLATNQLRGRIGQVFSLKDAAQAHRALEAGGITGSIVVTA